MISSKLYFTIGMPRCGKSTFCDRFVKENSNRVIVCSDDIRKALHGQRYEPLAETMVFAIKHVMIRAHLSRGATVIVDGTHSTDISIQRLLEIDECAVGIVFDTPKEVCIQRAIESKQMDLIPAINRIESNLLKLGWVSGNHDQSTVHKSLANILDKVKERNLYGKLLAPTSN